MVDETNKLSLNHQILVDDLPLVDTFLGIVDLKTGALIIAAVCVFHPMVYGCTLFMPMSYLLLTIWLLLGLFCVASVLLFWALTENNTNIMNIWIWYSVVFVSSMVLLLLLLAMLSASNKQWVKFAIILLGVLWYFLTAYFVLVVNSHRRAIIKAPKRNTLQGPMESPESKEPPNFIESTEPSAQQTTTTATEPEAEGDPETSPDNFKLLRKAFSVTGRSWDRRKVRSESSSDRPLRTVIEGSSGLGPGLSPEVHFSQEGTAKTKML